MPVGDFRTVTDELLHVAADAETFFQNLGFSTRVEIKELGFPFAPTLVCKRGHETVIVEVSTTIDQSRVFRWIRYCKSQPQDTRFYNVLRCPGGVDNQAVNFSIENRIGLCVHDDIRLMEVRASPDLAVHVSLPEITDLPRPLRPMLAPAFIKINDGDWRDGLSQAYAEVEQLAREYLIRIITSGRIVNSMARGRKTNLTVEEVESMTLGRLKDAFGNIQSQNQKDSLIGATLKLINKNRNGLAHSRRNPAVEAELRQSVGQHMYVVISCLEDLI